MSFNLHRYAQENPIYESPVDRGQIPQDLLREKDKEYHGEQGLVTGAAEMLILRLKKQIRPMIEGLYGSDPENLGWDVGVILKHFDQAVSEAERSFIEGGADPSFWKK